MSSLEMTIPRVGVEDKPAKPAAETAPVLPNEGLLQIRDVLAVIRVSRSTWWKWVQDGKAPEPVRIGAVTLWRAADLREFIADPVHYKGNSRH